MEDKYYTPSITEFRVGFEYEVLQKAESMPERFISFMPISDKDEWFKYKFPDPFVGYRLDLLFNKEIRVKYLDQEDIESLGFNYFKEYKQNNNKRFLIEKNNKGFWLTKLEKENYYTIEKVKYGETYGGVIEYFKGIIKNISELKVLLTQIGVGYD